MSLSEWFWNILISIDQLLNTIAKGHPDETISSRAAKARIRGHRWGCILCAILDFLDENHCNGHIENDRGSRKHIIMTPQIVNLLVYKNSTYVRDIRTDLDLSGFTLEGKFARTVEEDEPRYDLSATVIPPDSTSTHYTIRLQLNPEDTASLDFERYPYEVAIVSTDSNNGDYYRVPVLVGIIDLIGNVG